jgi:hypothetical protein
MSGVSPGERCRRSSGFHRPVWSLLGRASTAAMVKTGFARSRAADHQPIKAFPPPRLRSRRCVSRTSCSARRSHTWENCGPCDHRNDAESSSCRRSLGALPATPVAATCEPSQVHVLRPPAPAQSPGRKNRHQRSHSGRIRCGEECLWAPAHPRCSAPAGVDSVQEDGPQIDARARLAVPGAATQTV